MNLIILTQSIVSVEYTDCISAEEWVPLPNEFPGIITKQSDGDTLEFGGMQSTPCSKVYSDLEW